MILSLMPGRRKPDIISRHLGRHTLAPPQHGRVRAEKRQLFLSLRVFTVDESLLHTFVIRRGAGAAIRR